MLFLGNHTNKIDKKGRVSIPAPFRSALMSGDQQGLFVFKSIHEPTLFAAGMDYLRNLQQSRPLTDMLAPTGTDKLSLIFMSSIQPTIDPEGRMALPEDFLSHAQITDQVTFAGLGDAIQIWSPALFANRLISMRSNADSSDELSTRTPS